MSILPDLQEIITDGKNRLSLFNPTSEINISEQLWTKIEEAYLSVSISDKVDVIGGHTFNITTPEKRL